MESNKLSIVSRLLLIVSAVFLLITILVPLWRIELAAPQYPEGLVLLIYAGKLGGNVDIINGLNHYIGMQTLHTDNFIEFTILPYLLGFFSLLMLFSAIKNKKKWLYITLIAFIIFGVVSMIDFYRWEYNYGHNLDPNAAIIVPGMAYQPPLIGYKKLLNFEAFSIPALGGWLIVAAGILLLAAVITESGWLKKIKKNNLTTVVLFMLLLAFESCGSSGPEPVILNTDHCSNCKMGIADARFAAELITQKGRAYKFDDWHCMMSDIKQNETVKVKTLYIAEYNPPNTLIDASAAFFVKTGAVKSPMGGNVAAFSTREAANKFAVQTNSLVQNFDEIKTMK